MGARAIELAGDFVLAAARELRPSWHFGAERTAHYRAIIQSVGRFPRRNKILGRSSTPEELDFLAEEATKTLPLSAAHTASAVS